MKKSIGIIFLFFSITILSSCEKKIIENKLQTIQGKWKLTEFKNDELYVIPAQSLTIPKKDTIFDLNDVFFPKIDTHTIEFFTNNNPYTASQKGVYKIEYADNSIKAIIDTFSFTFNKKELVIDLKTTNKKKYNNIVRKPNLSIIPLPLYRFEFVEPENNILYLNATPFLNNQTSFLKFEKIN
jgi:hypothetical protein